MKVLLLLISWMLLPLTAALAYRINPNQAGIPSAADTVTVFVLGTHADSRFEPALLHVKPGTVIRFSVKEGMHTVTAYHPDNRREPGIPEGAKSFDSGILEAGDEWFLTLKTEGEYNYFCLPHEKLGHTGKVIVSPETLAKK